jgi:hypothetical protein
MIDHIVSIVDRSTLYINFEIGGYFSTGAAHVLKYQLSFFIANLVSHEVALACFKSPNIYRARLKGRLFWQIAVF